MALNPDSQLCYTWLLSERWFSSTSIQVASDISEVVQWAQPHISCALFFKNTLVLHAPQSKPILSSSVWLGMIKVWVSMALRASSDAHSKDDDLLCSPSMLKLTISTKEDHTCFPDCIYKRNLVWNASDRNQYVQNAVCTVRYRTGERVLIGDGFSKARRRHAPLNLQEKCNQRRS